MFRLLRLLELIEPEIGVPNTVIALRDVIK